MIFIILGELEIKPSFGIGKAPRDARPINKCNIFIIKKLKIFLILNNY